MKIDKALLSGSSATLILKLLEEQDMYGYQMIEELSRRSDKTFEMKAGTLYPLLHSLEKKQLLQAYEKNADSTRVRKYYRLTDKGKKVLHEKKQEWSAYSAAVTKILEGGSACVSF